MTTIPEIRARHIDSSYKSDDLLWCHEHGEEDRLQTRENGMQAHRDRAALLTHLDAMAKRLKEARRHVKIGGRAMQIIDEALKQAGYDT